MHIMMLFQRKKHQKKYQERTLSKFEEAISRIKTMIEKNDEPSYVADRSSLQSGKGIA